MLWKYNIQKGRLTCTSHLSLVYLEKWTWWNCRKNSRLDFVSNCSFLTSNCLKRPKIGSKEISYSLICTSAHFPKFLIFTAWIETDDKNLLLINAHFKPIFGGFREICYLNSKLLWFRRLFQDIVHSCMSFDSKVMKENVIFWKFSFLWICKKKIAKNFGLKNCS